MPRAPSDLHWSHPCVLWRQNRAWCQSARALCHRIPVWSLTVLENVHPDQWIPPVLVLCPPCTAPAQAAVTLAERFCYCRCFHVCLHSCHWWSGVFFLIAFFCLSLCLFGCLGFVASVQLLVLPVAETAGPFSELDVCTFSYRLSNEKKKKIYFLLIYYNGTKTTKLQTYEAFLLELIIVQFVKEVGNVSFLIICFALESSLCPQTVVVHWLSGLWWQELLGRCFQKIVAYNWNNT